MYVVGKSYVEAIRVVLVQKVGGNVTGKKVGMLDNLLQKRSVMSYTTNNVRVKCFLHSLEGLLSSISVSNKFGDHGVVVDGDL